MKIVYWVSDLSEKSQKLLNNHCKRQLKKQGYSNHEIQRHIEEIQCEKLINLEEIVSYKLMEKYSNM